MNRTKSTAASSTMIYLSGQIATGLMKQSTPTTRDRKPLPWMARPAGTATAPSPVINGLKTAR
jgi:hypothetical protein